MSSQLLLDGLHQLFVKVPEHDRPGRLADALESLADALRDQGAQPESAHYDIVQLSQLEIMASDGKPRLRLFVRDDELRCQVLNRSGVLRFDGTLPEELALPLPWELPGIEKAKKEAHGGGQPVVDQTQEPKPPSEVQGRVSQ